MARHTRKRGGNNDDKRRRRQKRLVRKIRNKVLADDKNLLPSAGFGGPPMDTHRAPPIAEGHYELLDVSNVKREGRGLKFEIALVHAARNQSVSAIQADRVVDLIGYAHKQDEDYFFEIDEAKLRAYRKIRTVSMSVKVRDLLLLYAKSTNGVYRHKGRPTRPQLSVDSELRIYLPESTSAAAVERISSSVAAFFGALGFSGQIAEVR